MSCDIKSIDFILKLDLGEPSEKAKEKALKELRETPENIENGLRELKKLLKDETDLNIPRTNDEWLIKFLRVCKFYPESARDLIKRHYNVRRKYEEITKVLVPSKLKLVFDANLVTILPQRDQHGRRIIVSQAGKHWNYKKIHRDILYAAGTLCTDLLQLEPETQINGLIYILDLQGLSFLQTFEFNPYAVKRILDYLQGNVPLRIKSFHIVNQPNIFQPIYAAAKPFFSKKHGSRIVLHGTNYKSLHEHISPDCLPECYGGNLKMPLMNGRETYACLEPYEKYFEGLKEYGFI
ncbi:alpha-tocopherol transfer protein-like [Cochliomyia hominivorax]